MRRFVLALGLLCALLAATPAAAGASTATAVQSLRRALRRDMGQIGGQSGAFVLDLNTGATLYADQATVGRLPASVQKLYTTTAVLARIGPGTRLSTTVWGRGRLGRRGVWHGTLYLKGGGDPTFGWASFDHSYYGGTGTTVQRLVANLVKSTGITAVEGTIVGDGGFFDSRRSTAESDFHPDPYMTGELSGLAFDRGFADSSGTAYQADPVLYAAQQFASELQMSGVRLGRRTVIKTGRTPSGSRARLLARVRSPTIAKLIQLTNTPSDNFMAEMLLKGLGARFGRGGTTAAGVAVVRSELSHVFGLRPQFNDGSGLSYADQTSPHQVVTLLQAMAGNKVFRHSLAIGGRTGTLQYEMRGTPAAGRCTGKTGTLHSVANLSGYCRARDGHLLAFAILANGIYSPDYVHSVEANQMAPALARYNG